MVDRKKANRKTAVPRGIYEMAPLDLKALLEARASNTVTPGTPGLNFRFLRPLPTRPGSPLPVVDPAAPLDDPCGGLPYVSQPALAARLIAEQCPEANTLTTIQNALVSHINRFNFPNPDVRVTCENAVITIMVWPTIELDPQSCESLARGRAWLPSYLTDGGNFGIYVAKSLIERLAQDAFANFPKRIQSWGQPSPDGPIHFTSLSLDFVEPDVTKTDNASLKTNVNGFDERPWPDVNFTVYIDDTFTPGPPLDTTTQTEVRASHIDEVEAFLAGLFVAFPGSFIPPLRTALIDDIDASQNQPHLGNSGGAGAALVAAIPPAIPFPHEGGPPWVVTSTGTALARVRGVDLYPPVTKQQLVIDYRKIIVNASGVYFRGFAQVADRVPTVNIAGPSGLSMDSNANQTFSPFGILATDFYGDSLTVQWTAGPIANITNPNARSTTIIFPRGHLKPGESYNATVSVVVSDTDGSTATASLAVSISVLDPGEGVPAICKVKPWLPQCQ